MIEVLWILFAISCGLTEGFLLHGRPPVKTKPDKHTIFDFQRIVVCVICAYHLYPNWLHVFAFAFYACLIFPLFHDGAMYEARRYLSKGVIYPRGWMEESTTTDAKISLGFMARIGFFILGCVPIIMYYIFKHQI